MRSFLRENQSDDWWNFALKPKMQLMANCPVFRGFLVKQNTMMRSGLFICALLFSNLIAVAQGTIYVENTRILSACGEDIVMRGYNEMFIWSGDRTGATTLPEIAQTGSNAVRLVWTTNGSVAEFDQLVTNSIANNMVPVAELHDATGDFSKLQLLLDYWKQPAVLDMIQKHKKWFILNIGNEIGNGSETVTQWVNYYKDAITQLRNAGVDVPIMIDAGGYGNQERYVVEGGAELLQFDPMHNIIFSVHTYWTNGGDADKIQRLNTLLSETKTRNLPLIIGEGPQLAASPISCGQLFPYKDMIRRLEEEGIGWLSWSWGLVDNNDCGAPNSVFDVTTDGKFGNWGTTFGEEISVTDPNSILNTSIIPPSLISGGNCGGTATYTMTTNALPAGGGSITLSPAGGSYSSGTIVTVSATAASGFSFDNWSGASASSVTSIQVTMNGNKSLTANFSEVGTGANTYVVRARGVAGDEQIQLTVDGQMIKTWTVATAYDEYTVNSDLIGDTRVEYINDTNTRDVRIDYLRINGNTYESEDQVVNTGVWQNGSCGGTNSEWINCPGYIAYATGGSSSNVAVTGVTVSPSTLSMSISDVVTV
ncbi:MAG: cellulase family glycosylhydrolase, partial [Bacteroidota bacterium]